MSWGTVAGALGILLALGTLAWYKFRSQTTDTALAQGAADQADKTAQLAEAQLAQKSQQERQELDEEIKRVKDIPDVDSRQRAALELLHRFRGVH